MSFISISFAILFLILVILYHLTARVAKNPVLIQNILLLAASLVFYAFADLRFLPFIKEDDIVIITKDNRNIEDYFGKKIIITSYNICYRS